MTWPPWMSTPAWPGPRPSWSATSGPACSQHTPARLRQQGTKAFLERYFRACPDARNTIEELVAEGAWVVVRMIDRGTQQGEWGGEAPRGQLRETEVLAMYQVVADQIVTAYSQGGPLHGAA